MNTYVRLHLHTPLDVGLDWEGAGRVGAWLVAEQSWSMRAAPVHTRAI